MDNIFGRVQDFIDRSIGPVISVQCDENVVHFVTSDSITTQQQENALAVNEHKGVMQGIY
jgi:hypothetical protein